MNKSGVSLDLARTMGNAGDVVFPVTTGYK